jgi:hypothetical protein
VHEAHASFGRDRGQRDQLRQGDQRSRDGRAGEGRPPADEVAEQLSRRQADDRSGGEAGEDDRGRAGALVGAGEAKAERRHDGPEAADRNPEERAREEHDEEARRDGRERVGQGHEQGERDDHPAAVEVAGADQDEWRRDRRAQSGHEHHEPGRAERDAEVAGHVGQEADGEELGRDDDRPGEAEREDREPRSSRGSACRRIRAVRSGQ